MNKQLAKRFVKIVNLSKYAVLDKTLAQLLSSPDAEMTIAGVNNHGCDLATRWRGPHAAQYPQKLVRTKRPEGYYYGKLPNASSGV